MKKAILAYLFLILVFIFSFQSCEKGNTPSGETPGDETPTEEKLTTNVIEITDGDTFAIYYKDKKWKVRVLYVDCFETKKGDRLSKQAEKAGISIDSALALGEKAKNFATEVLLNKKVDLLRDFREPNLDVYGRLLRITVINGLRFDSLLKVKGLAVPGS